MKSCVYDLYMRFDDSRRYISTKSRNQSATQFYPRNDTLGLPDTPHLRRVQNEGCLALDLLTEAVRVQNLEGTQWREKTGQTVNF